VINYDLTPDPETYVHRIGRTGRAGASGTAVSFCTAQHLVDLRSIERLLRAPLQVAAEPNVGNDAPGRQAGSRQTAARVAVASAGRNLFAGPKARRKRRGWGPGSERNGLQRTSR
jgi:ATP-dependent RNA helicase RhlE